MTDRMNCASILIGSLCTLLLGTAALAQAPASEIDAHIATAKAAAGQDYRGTFVNLCLPGAAPGGGRGAGAARRSGTRRGRDAGHARPGRLVRLALQGVRQSLLAWHAPALIVGAAHQRGHHHHRHEFRLGHAAGDHRRLDQTGPQPARHQIRHHQPRSWRP